MIAEVFTMKSTLAFALICVSMFLNRAFSEENAFAPSSMYHRETIEGITVLIHPDVLAHAKEAAEAREELKSQLCAMARAVPPKPLEQLRKVWIWVEWEKKKNGAAEFHPSREWLKEHGYNPEKAGHVELSNARNFVRWSRGEQPWMLLHEFAHAYHHLILGDDYEGIKTAYRQAVEKKIYESVPYCRGGRQRAYALTDEKEYFAELSEAYFGRNDFYPFTREELKKHDPVGFQLMEDAWGKPKGGK
jgi:hypothetical protein